MTARASTLGTKATVNFSFVRNVSTFEGQRSAACRGWDDSSVTFPPALGELNIMRESSRGVQECSGSTSSTSLRCCYNICVCNRTTFQSFPAITYVQICILTHMLHHNITFVLCFGRPHMWLSEGHPQHPLSGTGALRVSCRDPPV